MMNSITSGSGSERSLFSSVVFSGGGCRCLWQVGFWEAVAPALNLKPDLIAATSAGATMACAIFSGRMEFALRYMKEAVRNNQRNFYPLNLFNKVPMFPHEAIYRRAVLAAIDPPALERLRQGPEIRITLSRPPRWTTPGAATFLGFFCYLVERRTSNPVHPRLAGKVGFRPEVVDARSCRTPEDLLDLLLASSCTPPAVSIQRPGGRPALDGGLIDNSPVFALGDNPGRTLVLLTRRYPLDHLPDVPGRMYVQPSRAITIYKWDYTSPEGLQEAFDLGRRDGERFVEIYQSIG